MLNDKVVKNAQPKEKRYELKDTNGLVLDVTPKGVKVWRFRYSYKNKDYKLTLGEYPLISLKEAREMRDEARTKRTKGENPAVEVEEIKAMTLGEVFDSFMATSIEDDRHSPIYAKKYRARAEKYIIPAHGTRFIKDLTAQDVLSVLRPVESESKLELVARLKQIYSSLFRCAMVLKECDSDPTYALRVVLKAKQVTHYPRITDPAEASALMRAIGGYKSAALRNALLLHAYTFVRPGELRRAEWSEIDFDTALWKIPANKMKMRRPHVVPLSRQALEILERMKLLSGHGQYVFPSPRTLSASRPLSENAELCALRAMGYSDEVMVPHGFRGMASTLLHENGWPSDYIEKQLAHEVGNSVSQAYNHAEYLDKRTEMMQWWADYLDGLRDKV